MPTLHADEPALTSAEAPEDSLANNIDSSTDTPESVEANPAERRGKKFALRRSTAGSALARTKAPRAARPEGKPHPVRTFLTVTAVAGMVATVAIPAFAAGRVPAAEAAQTLEQVAADNAQTLVVGSEAESAALDRESYAATTSEEIEKKKAEEAAAKALAARLAASTASGGSTASSGSAASVGGGTAVPATIAVSGSVVRPLASFNNFGTPYAGHKGTDYMADAMTPIYAIADGTVVASSENGPGWGVYVKIAHNIGGQSVTTLYSHMSYGTRRVQVGETVSAGQLLGQVGETGRAFGTQLHLEVVVNGVYQVPESWLVANVG